MPIYSKTGDGTKLQRKPKMPRLGIIRLGTRETGSKDGREYTYPQASDHFELRDAEAVAKVYGDKCTVLDPIIIPVEDEDTVAAHYYRMYSGNQKLLCIGDNIQASRWVDADVLEKTGDLAPAKYDAKNPVWKDGIQCPCPFLESGQCRESLYFRFSLPNVPGVGVWQLRTNSPNSIQALQGCMALVRAIAGQVTGIDLKLSLVPTTMHSVGRGGTVTVYLLKLEVSGDLTIPQLEAIGRGRAGRTALPAAPGLGAVIDADYDDEENNDPEMTGWTSKRDLEEAEAALNQEVQTDTLTEADFDQPPAEQARPMPGRTAAAKANQTRGQKGRTRQSPPGAEPMDELKSDRDALLQLIKATVPNKNFDDIPADLNTWFPGKNRITQLTLEELNRAGPLFRKKYPSTTESPGETTR